MPPVSTSRYANNENYNKAISDFGKAVKLNPRHQNAMDYLTQTLLAYARE